MVDDRLARLREELRVAAGIEEPAGRALEVVAIVGEALGESSPRPVIVGGMAVYYWTANEAFLTADVDLVVPTSEAFVTTLSALGFARGVDGRHWELPESEVLLETPASELDAGAHARVVQAPSGRPAEVLSVVDVLVDRLAEFQATGHQIVGQQALVLLAVVAAEDEPALARLAAARRVSTALAGLRELGAQIERGFRPAPESDEWHALARSFERAEYHREQ